VFRDPCLKSRVATLDASEAMRGYQI